MKRPIILVVGTRAEAIKLIPVYLALKKAGLPAILCATFQHFELLKQVCDIFDVVPEYSLDIMKRDQDLFYLNTAVLQKTREVFTKEQPSLVMVHGDTTTTMASALSAFYLNFPIAHIEAGLRTGNMHTPFPEEMNRKVVGQIATYHFTPTAFATANMLAEGAPRTQVFCTGNPIVDALYFIREQIRSGKVVVSDSVQKIVEGCKAKKQKLVLLTAHRRESFNGGLLRVFRTMSEFAQTHKDVAIIFPCHPNPNVIRAVDASGIRTTPNVHLTDAVGYTDLVYLLSQVDWVATDSGGIQEEAVSLGLRTLCLRDVTERWEGLWEGIEVLVGTDPERIRSAMEKLYQMDEVKTAGSSIYGDGKACERIVHIVQSALDHDGPVLREGLAFRAAEQYQHEVR